MKPRVCIVHKVSSLDPRSFYKQARSLTRAGYDVTFYNLQPQDQMADGIRVRGLGNTGGRLSRFLLTNLRLFGRLLKERADVYHVHDLDFIPWAVPLKWLSGGKIVYDIHEAYPEYMLLKSYIPKPLRKGLSIAVAGLEAGCAPFFDALMPNDNFIAAGFRHRRNVTVFNFPTLDFFTNSRHTPWEEREFDLFYHGSLPFYHVERMMAVSEILNSQGQANRWGLVTNDAATIRRAEAEFARRGLVKNFTFLPYTDYLKVAEYLNRVKIGIIPLPPYKKFMKNIPLKMFEFMGCGIPIVLSDLPPSRQFIAGQDCAIAVEPENVEQYAAAIQSLLSDPSKALRMGANGKRLVFESLNWSVEEAKLKAVYEDLVGRGRVVNGATASGGR